MDVSSLTAADTRIAMVRANAIQGAEAADAVKKQGMTMKQIEQAAKDFEAMFLSAMIKPMFEGLDPDENFGGGRGEQVFRDFMIDEYGKRMVANGGLGIASMVKEELIRQQEGMSNEKG